MFLGDLLDLMAQRQRKNQRIKSAQKIAVGVGSVIAAGAILGILFISKTGKGVLNNMKKKTVNISESIKDAVQNGAETVQNSAEHAAEKLCDVIDDADKNSELISKNMDHGIHEVSQDIHKTAEAISKGLDKS